MSYVKIDEIGKSKLDRVNKILAGVGGNGSLAFKAVYAALKRASDTAKTQAGRFASARYAINKGTFMSNVRIKQKLTGGSGGVASIEVTYAGNLLRLVTFHTKAGPNGVAVSVKSGGGVLEHAFPIAKYGGNIYERVGSKRYQLELKYGPSTGHMMQDEGVVEDMNQIIETTFESRIEHEISRILGF